MEKVDGELLSSMVCPCMCLPILVRSYAVHLTVLSHLTL